MRRASREISLVWLTCMVLGLAGCGTVPETGRTQLRLLSTADERQLGIQSFERLKKELKISQDAQAAAMVEKVGRAIAAVAPLPEAQWEFVLFESAEANAFCLPGGKVGVYTGILPITKTEAGLAAVLGHEVAHAVARHGAERLTHELLRQLGGQALALGVSGADPRMQQMALWAYGVGTEVGAILPYSRLQESEADRIGLLYMARAGYDPREAIHFWQRFAEYNRRQGGGNVPVWLRTHPLDETRIRQLEQWMPEALAEYEKSQNRVRITR
ncbi:MAG: M48 family metallopeptidase [Verrucomicrobiota bacterium]|nr:M48 family metallopeptidase [Limisphaera sp.]MDW8383036.1 M48 family metallopeptidase [Verrucomicrobiota bacterium]